MAKFLKVSSVILNISLFLAVTTIYLKNGLSVNAVDLFLFFILFLAPLVTLLYYMLETSWCQNSAFAKKIGYSLSILVFVCAALMTYSVSVSKVSQIYERVILALVTKDDTYGGKLNPPKVYVSRRYSNQNESVNLPLKIQESLTKYCNNVGINIIWVDSPEMLKYNELGEIEGGGVLVTFSKIDRFVFWARLEGSIYIAGLAAGGTEYKFFTWLDGWRLYGSSQAWVS